MLDAAKYADLVLLMVDGGYGFEMDTFEFLNILQASPPSLKHHHHHPLQLLIGSIVFALGQSLGHIA